MTAQEQEQGQQAESRSSVKLTTNAKGDVQIEVKVRAYDDPAFVKIARELAETEFDLLRRKYPRA
jgi:tRNA threonylcarbamoyladenosine modification (KEOPS) complex  Pcc1 subunit